MTKLELAQETLFSQMLRLTNLFVHVRNLEPSVDKLIKAAKDEERQACLAICASHIAVTRQLSRNTNWETYADLEILAVESVAADITARGSNAKE